MCGNSMSKTAEKLYLVRLTETREVVTERNRVQLLKYYNSVSISFISKMLNEITFAVKQKQKRFMEEQ